MTNNDECPDVPRPYVALFFLLMTLNCFVVASRTGGLGFFRLAPSRSLVEKHPKPPVLQASFVATFVATFVAIFVATFLATFEFFHVNIFCASIN